MKKNILVLLVSVLFLLLWVDFSFARDTGAPPHLAETLQAKCLMEDGKYESAYNLLHPIYESEEDDRISFMLGLCCFHMKKYSEAITYYKKTLKNNPRKSRIHVELARAYLMVGKKELARQEFLAVKAAGPPPVVGRNIQRFLDIIEGRAPGIPVKQKWLAQIMAGLLYDSNANGGPSSASIFLFGKYRPNTDKKMFDTADEERLFLGHTLPLTNSLAWQSDFSFRHRGYHKHHGYNTDVCNLSTGPSLKSDKLAFSLPFLLEKYDIGSDKYSLTWGAAPQFQYPLTEKLSANLIFRGMKREYKRAEDAGRDGNMFAVEPNLRYNFFRKSFIKAGALYGEEDTDRDYYDNYFSEVYVTVQSELPYDFSCLIRQNVRWYRYDKCESPAFFKRRKDTDYRTYFDLKKDFGSSGWSASLDCSYTFDKSNLEYYRYRRFQIMFSISKIFGTT